MLRCREHILSLPVDHADKPLLVKQGLCTWSLLRITMKKLLQHFSDVRTINTGQVRLVFFHLVQALGDVMQAERVIARQEIAESHPCLPHIYLYIVDVC